MNKTNCNWDLCLCYSAAHLKKITQCPQCFQKIVKNAYQKYIYRYTVIYVYMYFVLELKHLCSMQIYTKFLSLNKKWQNDQK